MILTGLLSLPISLGTANQSSAEKWVSRGLFGELVLGFLFALSFCPVSAALFFGSLLPTTIGSGNVLMPLTIYGIGTAAPVALFALLMIYSGSAASRPAGGLRKVQPAILEITGTLLLLAGLYLTARDTLGLF